MLDKNGKILRIGDKVKFHDALHDLQYVFTIEQESICGWVWGSDIPDTEKYNMESKNLHNPRFCEKIPHTLINKYVKRHKFIQPKSNDTYVLGGEVASNGLTEVGSDIQLGGEHVFYDSTHTLLLHKNQTKPKNWLKNVNLTYVSLILFLILNTASYLIDNTPLHLIKIIPLMYVCIITLIKLKRNTSHRN